MTNLKQQIYRIELLLFLASLKSCVHFIRKIPKQENPLQKSDKNELPISHSHSIHSHLLNLKYKKEKSKLHDRNKLSRSQI